MRKDQALRAVISGQWVDFLGGAGIGTTNHTNYTKGSAATLLLQIFHAEKTDHCPLPAAHCPKGLGRAGFS
jgi:hypothetical protein